jgi:DNA replication licensing factor MCM3
MPERTPTGQLPRSISAVLEKDLVDKAKPGDRVEITGIYKCISSKSSLFSSNFSTVLLAIGVEVISD